MDTTETDKQIRLINAVNSLTGGLTLKNKMVIYKQANLTAILYCHEIWAPTLTGRSTNLPAAQSDSRPEQPETAGPNRHSRDKRRKEETI